MYASTLLPMAAFAIAWNSTATDSTSTNIVVRVQSVTEAALLIVGSVSVAGVLYLINRVVPASAVSIRLSLFSTLLYASLYFAYGQGYSAASFSMLFGVLFYLMFASAQIEEIGRRMVAYDLAANIAERLDTISARYQELRVVQDEIVLSDREDSVLSEEALAKSRFAQSQMDRRLSQQLTDVQSKRIELVQKMNQTQIQILEQKIDMLSTLFDVTSSEFSERLRQEFPKELEAIKEEAKDLNPAQLYDRMNGIMVQMSPILQGLPQSLGELRAQLLQAADELEEQTRLFLADSTSRSKEGEKQEMEQE